MIGLKILKNLGLFKAIDHNHKRFDRLAKRLESPIEKIFWSAGYFELSKWGELTPQVRVEGYRVDFAYLVGHHKIAIELDGYDYHSRPEQMARDYSRQRELTRSGWIVYRFTGSDINGDVQNCVREVVALVRGLE